MAGTELAELAAWAEARLPGLIDAARTATVERIQFYRDERIVPAEELRGSIERNMQFLVTAIGDPIAPLDLAAAAYALRLNTATALWQGRQPAAAVDGRTSDRAQAGARR